MRSSTVGALSAPLVLACGGLPVDSSTSTAPTPAPELALLVDQGDRCALVIEGEEQRTLGRWDGACTERWGMHTLDGERVLVLTLGDEPPRLVELANGQAEVLPPPDDGRLEVAGYDDEGRVVAWTEEETEGDDTDMFGTVTCRQLTYTDGAWQLTHQQDRGLYEGMSPPWCDGLVGMPLGMLFPARFAHHEDMGRDPPPEQPAPVQPAGADMGSWQYLAETQLLVQTYWFEGQFLLTPAAHWDGQRWATLEGLEAIEAPLELTVHEDYLIACTRDGAYLYDPARTRVWTGARCPAPWHGR